MPRLGVAGWQAQKRRTRRWEGGLTRGETEAGKKAADKEQVKVVRPLQWHLHLWACT